MITEVRKEGEKIEELKQWRNEVIKQNGESIVKMRIEKEE
jgi:hypothetical protein